MKNPVCDFCIQSGVEWAYDADDVQLPTGDWSRGGWAACNPCHLLIDSQEWQPLIDRVLDHSPTVRALGGSTAVRELFRFAQEAILLAFRRGRLGHGPARRVGEGDKITFDKSRTRCQSGPIDSGPCGKPATHDLADVVGGPPIPVCETCGKILVTQRGGSLIKREVKS